MFLYSNHGGIRAHHKMNVPTEKGWVSFFALHGLPGDLGVLFSILAMFCKALNELRFSNLGDPFPHCVPWWEYLSSGLLAHSAPGVTVSMVSGGVFSVQSQCIFHLFTPEVQKNLSLLNFMALRDLSLSTLARNIAGLISYWGLALAQWSHFCRKVCISHKELFCLIARYSRMGTSVNV